jgi:hypothetical protein
VLPQYLLRSGAMPGEHVFVDESKRGAYVVAAVVIAAGDVGATRAAVKRAATELPGTRRRVHFQTESDAVRRKFLAQVIDLPVTARIYTARERTERASRQMILTRLVGDLVAMGASSLVLERDESLMVHDERVIKAERARLRAVDVLRYDLKEPSDPMLWLPDAIAWAWCRDRVWRCLVAGLVTEETKL